MNIERERHKCPKCGHIGFNKWICNQFENKLYSACQGCGFYETRRPNDYVAPTRPLSWWERFLQS